MLHLRMGESRTRANFGIASELVVPILLGTTYIDRFIRSIHPAERKIVPYHYPPVPKLIVYKARSEPEIEKLDSHQNVESDLALLVTASGGEPKYITVVRQVVLRAVCETPVIVSTQVACILEVILHRSVANNHLRKMAKGIMYIYRPPSPFLYDRRKFWQV